MLHKCWINIYILLSVQKLDTYAGRCIFFTLDIHHPVLLWVRLFKEEFRGDQAGYGTFTACFLLEPQLNAICLL